MLTDRKPYTHLKPSNFSVSRDQICKGTEFDGTLEEAVDICYGHGHDFCKGIHDEHCDGQVIKLCVEIRPTNLSNSTLYGCTYLEAGKAILVLINTKNLNFISNGKINL